MEKDKLIYFVRRSPFYGQYLPYYHHFGPGQPSEWNGYVAIPREFDPANRDYDKLNELINYNVHGGLTYSGSFHEEEIEQIEKDNNINIDNIDDYVIYGFDTLHCDDSRNKWPKEAVLKEAKRLRDTIWNIIKR